MILIPAWILNPTTEWGGPDEPLTVIVFEHNNLPLPDDQRIEVRIRRTGLEAIPIDAKLQIWHPSPNNSPHGTWEMKQVLSIQECMAPS